MDTTKRRSWLAIVATGVAGVVAGGALGFTLSNGAASAQTGPGGRGPGGQMGQMGEMPNGVGGPGGSGGTSGTNQGPPSGQAGSTT